MNKQEIFDTCAKHLITQNEPSSSPSDYIGPHGRCYYRKTKEDGTVLKCAVGILIPDDVYDSSMESSVGTLIEKIEYNMEPFVYLDKTVFNNDNKSFLRDIQRVHDQNPVDQWKPELKKVATSYDLEYKFD